MAQMGVFGLSKGGVDVRKRVKEEKE